MKVRNLDTPFAGGPIAKALAVNVHSDGAISISSDVPGATVSVTQDEDSGAVTIAETLPDGSAGETISIAVVTPSEDD